MPRADRETRTAVPFDRCTGVVGGWALAAQLVETPAFASTLIIEGVSKLAALVKWSALASIVNALPKIGRRPAKMIQFRNAAKRKEMCEHTGNHDRNWWTA